MTINSIIFCKPINYTDIDNFNRTTIKCKLIYQFKKLLPNEDMRTEIFKCIGTLYNKRRRHSTLGSLSIQEFYNKIINRNLLIVSNLMARICFVVQRLHKIKNRELVLQLLLWTVAVDVRYLKKEDKVNSEIKTEGLVLALDEILKMCRAVFLERVLCLKVLQEACDSIVEEMIGEAFVNLKQCSLK